MVRAFVVVTALVLAGAGQATATDEGSFLNAMGKHGISTGPLMSKKPCLCAGGFADGRVGTVLIFRTGSQYSYDCRAPGFNNDGDQVFFTDCIVNGGSVVVLSK